MTARPPPHDFGEAAAAYHLESLPDQIAENRQRIVSGDLDDNLPTIFHSQAQHTAELAVLRYFYGGAPVDEVLDLFGQSALATANMFRLLGLDGASPVTFEWDGAQRTVPRLDKTSLHHGGKLHSALSLALISGRSGEIDCLTGLERGHLGNRWVAQSKFAVEEVQFLQRLFAGDASAPKLRDKLAKSIDGAYAAPVIRDWLGRQVQAEDATDAITPDALYLKARSELYFTAVDADAPTLQAALDGIQKLHGRHFDTEDDNRRYRTLGLLCLPALAVAVLACRRGCAVHCTGPYAPQDLLEAALDRNSL